MKVLVHAGGSARSFSVQTRLYSVVADLAAVLGPYLEAADILVKDAHALDAAAAADRRLRLIDAASLEGLDPRLWLDHHDLAAVSLSNEGQDDEQSSAVWSVLRTIEAAYWRRMKIVTYVDRYGSLNSAQEWLVARALKHVDLVLVSSPATVKKLKVLGVTNELFCTASGILLQRPPSEPLRRAVADRWRIDPAQHPIVVVCPREMFSTEPPVWTAVTQFTNRFVPSRVAPEDGKESRQRFIAQMAGYSDYLVKRHGAQVVFAAMKRPDQPITRAIQETMTERAHSRLISGADAALDELSSLLAVAALQVTARPTSLLLGSPFGVPPIALGDNPALEEMMREAGLTDYYLDYATPGFAMPNLFALDEALQERTERAFAHGEELREAVLKSHGSSAKRARQNRMLLGEWLIDTFFEGQAVLSQRLSIPA
ncbi:MAG: hypothetical protein C4523_12320 [Myxococcales bacterium]|nr:MAG: hypothetical protein C4523_12320 [Myxococcales bacterium]